MKPPQLFKLFTQPAIPCCGLALRPRLPTHSWPSCFPLLKALSSIWLNRHFGVKLTLSIDIDRTLSSPFVNRAVRIKGSDFLPPSRSTEGSKLLLTWQVGYVALDKKGRSVRVMTHFPTRSSSQRSPSGLRPSSSVHVNMTKIASGQPSSVII